MAGDVVQQIVGLKSLPDRVYVWFDSLGRIVQMTETKGVNEPPSLPGYVEFTGAPIAQELRRFPRRFYRKADGNLERRQPVRILLSRRVIPADGVGSLVARVVGVNRSVKVRVDGEPATIDQDGLTVTSLREGMFRVSLHEDEVDLMEEDPSNSFAIARRAGSPNGTPTPGTAPGR